MRGSTRAGIGSGAPSRRIASAAAREAAVRPRAAPGPRQEPQRARARPCAPRPAPAAQRLIGLRPQRQHGDITGPPVQGRQDRVQPVGAMDQRQPAARPQPREAGRDPARRVGRRRGAPRAGGGRGRACRAGSGGRAGWSSPGRRPGRAAPAALGRSPATSATRGLQAVGARRCAAASARQLGVALEAGDARSRAPRAARHKDAAPVPAPASSTRSPGLGRDRGGEQHRVDRHPVAPARLEQAHAAAEQGVRAGPRSAGAHRRSRPRPRPRAAAAPARGRPPRTRSRRGKAPMLPSTALTCCRPGGRECPPPRAWLAPRTGGRGRCCAPVRPRRPPPCAAQRPPGAGLPVAGAA